MKPITSCLIGVTSLLIVSGCSDNKPNKSELCRTLLSTDAESRNYFKRVGVDLDEFCTCFQFEMAYTDRVVDTKYSEALKTLIETRLEHELSLNDATVHIKKNLRTSPADYDFTRENLDGLQDTFKSISDHMSEHGQCRVYTPD